IYVKSQETNPCLSFKNEIINSLYEDNYDINENFITKTIHDDRDKDIIVIKEDIETLISCKFRNKRNIGFDDVERTAIISNYYDVQGVIVTNRDYSKKATKAASEHDVILSYQSNLKRRLNYYIENELNEKELN
ncbi:2542_t:CDS:1, partial [Cetraspora pellucida]